VRQFDFSFSRLFHLRPGVRPSIRVCHAHGFRLRCGPPKVPTVPADNACAPARVFCPGSGLIDKTGPLGPGGTIRTGKSEAPTQAGRRSVPVRPDRTAGSCG